MDEALKEIWKTKFEKAMKNEYDIVIPANEKEIELLKIKIDKCLEIGNIEGFKKLSKELKGIESFLSLKSKMEGLKWQKENLNVL